MRAMSVKGLCNHIGVADLKYYRQLPEYYKVLGRISNTIYVHNFNGAAVGLLNGRIIGNTLRRDHECEQEYLPSPERSILNTNSPLMEGENKTPNLPLVEDEKLTPKTPH